MIIWLNNALTGSDAARIDPGDRGLTLGDGLFETMVARGGCIQRLDSHLERLRAGAAVIGLVLPDLAFSDLLAATLDANGLVDAVLRLTVTRGHSERGLLPPAATRPTVMVTAAPLPPKLPPARCIVATTTRRNEYSPLCGVKSLNYLDNILARMEAAGRGADDAVLLNTKGRVAETSVANLFIVKDGIIHTPPLAEGALPGTMRADVLNNTQSCETPLSVSDILAADEVFLTNSLGIRGVIELDGTDLGQGPLTVGLEAFLYSY